MPKKGARKAPSAAQLANQARFAAAARGGSFRGSMRGAVSMARGTSRKLGSSLRDAFHRISWGVAAMAAVAGYFIPQTLTNLGVGYWIADHSPMYASASDTMWTAVNDMGVPPDQNPWQNAGLMGWGKLTGIGYGSKLLYDWQKTGQISRGKLNVGLPLALGLILDGPELHPMAPGGASAGTGMAAMVSQGGVSW